MSAEPIINNGSSFSGPLLMSGLAVSKGALLHVMERYMDFMANQYELVIENLDLYTTFLNQQADAEKKNMLDQANADFSAGISDGIGSIAGAALTLGAHFKGANKTLRAEAESVNKSQENLTNIHTETLDIVKNPAKYKPATPAGGAASGTSVSSAPAVGDKDVDFVKEVSRGNTKHLNDIAESDPKVTTGTAKEQLSNGIRKMQERVNEIEQKAKAHAADSNNAAPTAEERAQMAEYKSVIKNTTEALGDHVKQLQTRHNTLQTQMQMNQQRWQIYSELGKSVSNAAGSGARLSYTQSAADEKKEATIAQGVAQGEQSLVQHANEAASGAAQHGEGYIRMLKELQAANSSRA
jgi:hypothetical protein